MDKHILPFLLLAAALIALLLSTRQFSTWIRAAVWIVGAALLAWSACLVLGDDGHYGLLRFVADALSHGLKESVLLQVLTGNWGTVTGALTAMFDIFFALAAFAALVALIAFTPGEAIDMAVRPPILFLLGAIGGGFLALSIMASGLGGYPKDRVYAGVLTGASVVDGDGLKFGDVSLRLNGVDAPEFHESEAGDGAADDVTNGRSQFCLDASASPTPCGASARDRLADLIENNLVVCKAPNDGRSTEEREVRNAQLKESFGRPIVQCWVYVQGGE